jgi:hypothetical protein
MKTTLHIGTTKTGSKSIQTFLSENRSLLAQQGILFPETLGHSNHFSATVYAGGPGRHADLARQIGLKTDEDYTTFAETIPQKLADEIAEHQPEHVIISNEHLHSRFRTVEEFVRLKQLLGPSIVNGDVQVIVYLRPQVEHIISLYSTMLRGGYAGSSEDFITSWAVRPASPYFNFKELLTLWGNAFGRESLRVRSYRAVKSLDHGVVTDFISAMGIDAAREDIKFPHTAHMSMGARAAEIILAMNRQDPKMPYYVRRGLLAWVRYDLRGGKICPDPDVLRPYDALFHASNQEVIDTWMPDHPDAFAVDWDQFTASGKEPALSTESVLKLVEKLNPSFKH